MKLRLAISMASVVVLLLGCGPEGSAPAVDAGGGVGSGGGSDAGGADGGADGGNGGTGAERHYYLNGVYYPLGAGSTFCQNSAGTWLFSSGANPDGGMLPDGGQPTTQVNGYARFASGPPAPGTYPLGSAVDAGVATVEFLDVGPGKFWVSSSGSLTVSVINESDGGTRHEVTWGQVPLIGQFSSGGTSVSQGGRMRCGG